MLKVKSYPCLVVLTCWGYVSVCELGVTINISADALLINELVSYFWDLETAQWHCKCLHGIVNVICVASLFCLFACLVLCVEGDGFSNEEDLSFVYFFLNEQTL